jgi:hypothetical protein
VTGVEFPIHSGQWFTLGYAGVRNLTGHPVRIVSAQTLRGRGRVDTLPVRLLIFDFKRKRVLAGGADGWPPKQYPWVGRLPRSLAVPPHGFVGFAAPVRPHGAPGSTVRVRGLRLVVRAGSSTTVWALPAPATMHIVAASAPQS